MSTPGTETALPLHLCQVLEQEHEALWGPLPECPGWELTPDQILLVPLLERLGREKEKENDPVASRVLGLLHPELRERIARSAQAVDDHLAADLTADLNRILAGENLCEKAFCEDIDLPPEVQIILADGEPLQGEDRQRVNRLILEAALPREVRKIYDLRLAAIHRQSPAERSALCLSGGGIRSAVFSLGVLQGLARRGLLEKFDYLSTVSGGGYMGSLLSAWIHRHPRGIDGVSDELAGRSEVSALAPEPAPLSYLRSYSNYLSPRLGLFSADAWTLASTYVRNLYLHWLTLIPLLISVLLVPRLYIIVLRWAPDRELGSLVAVPPWLPSALPHLRIWHAGLFLAGSLLMSAAITFIGLHRPSGRRRTSQAMFLVFCLAPLVTSAEALTIFWAWYRHYNPKVDPTVDPDWLWFLLPAAAINVVGWSVHAVPLMWQRKQWRPKIYELFFAILAGLFGGLLTGLAARFPFRDPERDFPLYICVAVPTLLLIFLAGETLFAGLASQWTDDEDREWWARSGAWVMIALTAWLGICFIAMVGPVLLSKLPEIFAALGGVSAVATALLAKSSRTMESKAKPEKKDWKALLLDGALGLVAPIFVLILLAGLSFAVGRILHDVDLSGKFHFGKVDQGPEAQIEWKAPPEGKKPVSVLVPPIPVRLNHAELLILQDRLGRDNRVLETTVVLAGFLLLGLIMSRLMNINKFSLHSMYRNRLIRTFLGATRDERRPNPFTGFDPDDNLEIHELGHPLFLHRQELAGGGASLCLKLLRPGDPAAELLKNRLAPDTVRGLESWAGGGLPGADLVIAVLADLNRLLRREVLSDKELETLGARDFDSWKIDAARPAEERQRWVRQLLVRSLGDAVDVSHPPRPFHVVNVALNLVAGKKLAWQQRKAEPFSFTPLHCGSVRAGYRAAREYGKDRSGRAVSFGTAVAISGAAASPNMGYHSSPAITFLMTFFNVRLGWWLGNPGAAGRTTYDRSHPKWAVGPLIDEALGLTDDTNEYVYLSDGGHFENMGLYEMVLRRCRTIVAVDAGEDHDCRFEDLGNAIRKIRIDLGIPIDIDKISIYAGPEKVPTGGRGRYCAVGTIRYSCIDGAVEDGTLLYFKPAVYGTEPRDILHYREQNPLFPHESTGDQWFSESQFESYRMLGSHAVDAVCGAEQEIADLAALVECARAHTQGAAGA